MKKSRTRQEGSIYKRIDKRKDGSQRVRWCGSVSLYDNNGQRVRSVVYGDSKAQAAIS